MAHAATHRPHEHKAMHSGSISGSGDTSDDTIDTWLAECETAAQREVPALESKVAEALATGDFHAVSAMLAGPLAGVVHAPRKFLPPGSSSSLAAGLTVVLTLGAHGAVVATALDRSPEGSTDSNSSNGSSSNSSNGSTDEANGTHPNISTTCAAEGIHAVWVSAVPDLRALADVGLGPPAGNASETTMDPDGVGAKNERNGAGASYPDVHDQEPPLSINVTGAGDTMVGATAWHLSHQHNDATSMQAEAITSVGVGTDHAHATATVNAVAFGVAAAAAAVLETSTAVPRALSRPAAVARLEAVAERLTRVALP